MMGSLDLIHAEPYSKSNLEKPFLNKPRGLINDECFKIIYGDGGIYSWKGDEDTSFYQDGSEKTEGIYNGTTTLLCWDDPLEIEDLSNFFEKVGDHEKIKFVDLSNFQSSVSNLQSFFSGCANLEAAFLSRSTTLEIDYWNDIFSGCNNLKILDISFLKFTPEDGDSFGIDSKTLEYLDITGTTLPYSIISEFKAIDNLTICQGGSSLIIKSNYRYSCCDYKDGDGTCEADNYMKISLNENAYTQDTQDGETGEVYYEFNFSNYKESIRFVLSGESGITDLGEKTQVDSEFIIYFNKPFTNLDGFFKSNNKIKEVDLSHFDFSKVESAKEMFSGSFIETIDLSNRNAPELTNIASMFAGCSQLKSVNLNNFSTPKVTNMDNIFSNCENIKFLDISGFDFKSQTSEGSLFPTLGNLIYLNTKNATFNGKKNNDLKILIDTIIEGNDKAIICENGEINKSGKKNKFKCCNFIPDVESCESFSFIKAKYEIDNTQNGQPINIPIIIDGGKNHEINPNPNQDNEIGKKPIRNLENTITYNGNFLNEARKESVVYIKKQGKLLKPSEEFTIETEEEIEIYFSEEITSLKDIFNNDLDNNVDKIVEITFYNFSTSLVTNMNSMFAGCSSLKSIDLYNFNTSKLTDMGSMFKGCTALEYVKLHHFNTSSVTDISYLFSGCNKLAFIDISSFNLKNVNNYEYMFDSENSALKYINLYNVEDPEGIITKSNLNNVDNLMVCQKEGLITNENKINTCCYFDVEKKECQSDTYDIFRIMFATDVNYTNGFKNDNRNNIKFIIDKDHINISSENDEVNFIAGNIYEIYLQSPVTELANYFKSEKIKSVDVILPNSSSVNSLESMFDGCSSLESVSLVYIDTSSVESFKSMFRKCSSLKSLDFSHFDTSKLTTMENMFSGCSSLEFLDLSYFDTSNVNSMSGMFFQCGELKVLDISSFSMEKISDSQKMSGMFNGLQSLKYLNLFNAKDSKYYMNDASYLKLIKDLTICQKEEIIKKTTMNFSDICCYYNISTNSCESDNYMLIYYDQDVTYENGFEIDDNLDTSRNKEYFIINKDYFNKKNKNDRLFISKGSKLEIYYTSEITTLANYFDADSKYDQNAQYIKKVDLSHFDLSTIDSTASMFSGCSALQSVDFFNKKISSLKEMNSMFYGCKSLEEVDLLHFNTSLVENMESMFEGCEKIELIDLSNFDTSSVNNMANMFNGCKNLTFLDIFSFNFENIENIEDIFNGATNLEYINLYNAKYDFSNPLEDLTVTSTKNLTVCQKEKIITQSKNDDCYYFNISNHTDIESNNFIIIYFGKDTIYEKGFINDNSGNKIREAKDIDFIINGNHSIKYKATDRLFISKGQKIEIYFSNITNLKSYFSVTQDPNMENVVSLDLSHFNTSFVTNMALMFNGCTSLKSIDLYDINTSLVTDMNNMFNDCKELEILDLSSFNTSLVTNMAYMFNGCESLIYLDISNFNLEKILDFTSVFSGADNLQYVNLYYIQNSNEYITNSELNDLEEVTVCQKEYLVTNENATFREKMHK